MRTGILGLTVTALLLPASAGLAQAGAKKTLVVASDGSGQFKTVQDAVDSTPSGNVRIEIKPGEYRALISIRASGVELHGMGKRPEDVVLVYDNSAGTPAPTGSVGPATLGTGRSATVMLTGDGFLAENLTIANDFEKRHQRTNEGSQAVALHVTGDREVFRNVRFLGFQDTLYADSKTCHAVGDAGPCRASRQYYADCYIEGHVDFIFGDAKAVFDRCEIHTLPHVMDTITAQSRVRPEEDSGYVFRDCTVTSAEGSGDILLGRPWRAYSTVIFLSTTFKAPLDPAGWKEWNGALATSDYAEFNSQGMAGDLTKRIAPSKQLTAAEVAQYATRTWLGGTEGWEPEKLK
jgi:pectin methylesterase-like acyl-CoA thioesterase